MQDQSMDFDPNRISWIAFALIYACGTALAAGDPAAGEQKSVLCVGCHGVTGRSTEEDIPKLSGQLAGYIVRATLEFQSGIRNDPMMSSISNMLRDPKDLEDIAAYFSSQLPMKGQPTTGALARQGERLFTSGRCNYCHGEGGKRFAPFAPVVPTIGGQHKTYLIKAMKDIRDDKRPGDAYDMMKRTVAEMSDTEIEAVAEYLSGL
jgi:cytochrome c553